MALQGKIEVSSVPGSVGGLMGGSESYNIIECEYQFSQSIDETGKPTSRPRGGTITFVLPTVEDDDSFFYDWMFNKSETHSGQFVFTIYGKNNRRRLKHLKFTNAYCIDLKEYFSDNDSRLMYMTIVLSAEKIELSKAVFDNKW